MKNLIRILSALLFPILSILVYNTSAAAERMAVVSDYANIRMGPGTNYDIIWKIEKNHPIEILEKKGKWYHFKDFEDDEGWIYASLVGKIAAVITKGDRCNVRNGPGTNYRILFSVERGVPFREITQKGKWIQIKHADGDQGWIHSSLVW
jgi:SH3-like domain-containing protein